jgi:ATP-dependent DNA helicase DinG
VRLVSRAFNEDAVVCAEAGTGVGKSFAYLLPSMAWAVANDERVVISTATINLQQQLFDKDIPLVASAMGKKVKAVLLKGRSNYLCLRRLADAMVERELFPEEGQGLEAIAAWAETTKTGSRSDLPFLPDEGVWSRVCSESDTCLAMRCPDRERCFFLALRREAAEARILVVNHHLLFADLAARESGAGYDGTVVLPPYDRVIVDEAHTIEDSATSFFSDDFGRLGVYRQFARLYRRRRGLELGLVLRLATITSSEAAVDDISEAILKAREAIEALDTAGLQLVGDEGAFRLTGPKDGSLRSVLLEPLAEVRRLVGILVGLVRGLLELVGEEDAEDPAVWETKAVLRRIEGIGSVCGRILEYDERPDEVFWIERRRSGKGESWARFIATPLDVAPSLRDALFAPNRTVACVSATLTVADSFSYWLGRSGAASLAERPLLDGRFPSPFPYRNAVLLAVPTDAPLPEEERYRPFVDAAVPALLLASGGSALVLFTSYEALRSAYAASRPVLEAAGLRVLKQGDDDRGRLLAAFLEDETSVLFATDSFWEGVDAPGNTLRLVIICRLPFRSPNDPVFEARREALERRGGNAFMELSLPEAVMKFKQGFGRLMRRSSDHGAVVVLDGRLLKKRYGELFLRSLPETQRCFEVFDEMAAGVGRFLDR